MTSPEKCHLGSIVDTLESFRAKSSLQQIELDGLREAQHTKKPRAGITVRKLGTHLFSTEEEGGVFNDWVRDVMGVSMKRCCPQTFQPKNTRLQVPVKK